MHEDKSNTYTIKSVMFTCKKAVKLKVLFMIALFPVSILYGANKIIYNRTIEYVNNVNPLPDEQHFYADAF